MWLLAKTVKKIICTGKWMVSRADSAWPTQVVYFTSAQQHKIELTNIMLNENLKHLYASTGSKKDTPVETVLLKEDK